MLREQDRIDAERCRETAIRLRKEAHATIDPYRKEALTRRAMQYEGLYYLLLDQIIYPKIPDPFWP
jgi:hypothetical protein